MAGVETIAEAKIPKASKNITAVNRLGQLDKEHFPLTAFPFPETPTHAHLL